MTPTDADLDQVGVAPRAADAHRSETRTMAALLDCVDQCLAPADRAAFLRDVLLPRAERGRHDLTRLVSRRLARPPVPDGVLVYPGESAEDVDDVRVVLEGKQGAATNATGAEHTLGRDRFAGTYSDRSRYPDPTVGVPGWHAPSEHDWECCGPWHTQRRSSDGLRRAGLAQWDFYRIYDWTPAGMTIADAGAVTWLAVHNLEGPDVPYASELTEDAWTSTRYADLVPAAYAMLVRLLARRGTSDPMVVAIGAFLRSVIAPYGPGRPWRTYRATDGRVVALGNPRRALDRLWTREARTVGHRDRDSVVEYSPGGTLRVVMPDGGAVPAAELRDWHADIRAGGHRLPGGPCEFCGAGKLAEPDCGHVDDEGYTAPGPAPWDAQAS